MNTASSSYRWALLCLIAGLLFAYVVEFHLLKGQVPGGTFLCFLEVLFSSIVVVVLLRKAAVHKAADLCKRLTGRFWLWLLFSRSLLSPMVLITCSTIF